MEKKQNLEKRTGKSTKKNFTENKKVNTRTATVYTQLYTIIIYISQKHKYIQINYAIRAPIRSLSQSSVALNVANVRRRYKMRQKVTKNANETKLPQFKFQGTGQNTSGAKFYRELHKFSFFLLLYRSHASTLSFTPTFVELWILLVQITKRQYRT